jgi:hypothetical protein
MNWLECHRSEFFIGMCNDGDEFENSITGILLECWG